MEIEEICAYPVELSIRSFEEPHGLAPFIAGYSGYNETVDRTLIKITTDDGISGWGEMFTILPPDQMIHYIEEKIGGELIGESFENINSFVNSSKMHSYIDTRAFTGGVEIALWDCLGKSLGVPIHQLFGGKMQEKVEYSYALGIQSIEQTIDSAKQAYSDGFRSIKTKVGGYDVKTDPEDLDYTRSIESDVKRLLSIKENLESDIKLRVDANESLRFDQALKLIKKISNAGIHLEYFEQPLPRGEISSYKRLINRVDIPIAVNEDAYNVTNFHHMIQSNNFDIGVVDIIPAGGFKSTKQLAAIAGSKGIPLAHHCGFHMGVSTAAGLHLISTTPEFSLPSGITYYSHEDFILENPFELDNASLEVPDEPGLGVSVDMEKVEELCTTIPNEST